MAVDHFDFVVAEVVLLAEVHDILENILRAIDLRLFVVQLPFGEVVESS